ncbi:flagella basal body P-ring formation protein FlgA [Burkholderia sp. SG-MS1]|uniref:flagellar basal body P-ring formation chaperone FlgA n=1 Tax=Paraburkholderia sp. SG-MS1 TaxID=2023741 RepID=UPI001447EDD0|nr:flagellar basal body P-ring formation chaperone FlgA [Paraburkholderia sp. SG-MS1]NKJ45965.1 flagella basal body P-ring formation protein FlgA [Paraburkholderia sp. SG-MS1]
MDQPTSDLPQRASRAAAHRPGASLHASSEAAAVASLRAGRPARVMRLAPRLAMRAASRVFTRLVVSVALWVAGGIVLLPGTSQAQEAGGPIVIPGPAEKNPGALADIAQQMRTPSQRAASASSLAAATAQSIGRGPAPRDADPFTRAAGTNGAIVIPGANEPAAAPAMIRTNFKPDANGVVTIPAPGNGGASANVARVNVAPASRAVMPVLVTPAPTAAPAAVQPVDASAPQGSGFDSLASRGEPPQFGANGKPIAPAATAMPNRPVIARTPAVRQPAPAVAQKNMQAAVITQPATLPGQQDAEAIHAAALAFLQQQSAGLPGKIDITVASAFPRGLSACAALEPFMPTGARLWGRMTVGVRCAGERPWTIYLQARISLHATYYLAARAMAPGEVLTAADLVARDGDLTGLPQAIVTDPSQAVGSVSLVRIAGGMPLRRDMLKSASAVAIGQTVRVVAAGDGFSISAEGSAMNNASPGQQVRVKTANGQVISGIVKDGATVEIQL